MKRGNRIGGVLMGVCFLAVPGCGDLQDGVFTALTLSAQEALGRLSPTLPPASGARPVTLFSYVAMDDVYSGFGAGYMKALEQTASPHIHNVAFLDQAGPDNSLLYRVMPGPSTNRLDSPFSLLAPGVKEVNSDAASTLAATASWAYGTHPGHMRVIDVFTHGAGFLGLGSDATRPQTTPESMTVKEFGDALRQATGGQKLDLIKLLSCLMGTVELAAELVDATDVMLASELEIGMDHSAVLDDTKAFQNLLARPRPDARDVAVRLVSHVAKKHEAGQWNGHAALAAIDLTRIPSVVQAVDRLSQVLLAILPTHHDAILAAYDAGPLLSMTMPQRDLWHFCERLKSIPHPALTQTAQGVQAALKKAVIASFNQDPAATFGLGIGMPERGRQMQETLEDPIYVRSRGGRFWRQTAWYQFIEAIAKGWPSK